LVELLERLLLKELTLKRLPEELLKTEEMLEGDTLLDALLNGIALERLLDKLAETDERLLKSLLVATVLSFVDEFMKWKLLKGPPEEGTACVYHGWSADHFLPEYVLSE
jgi:hypothetical protein